MKSSTQILFLIFTFLIISYGCEEKSELYIECPCIFKDDQAPYFKSCEDMGEVEGRWDCMKEALLQSVYQNLIYPEAARADSTEGNVIVAILINEEGEVIRSEIRSDSILGNGLEEASLEVMDLFNDNWCPGLVDCQPVESEFVLPIKFLLAK